MDAREVDVPAVVATTGSSSRTYGATSQPICVWFNAVARAELAEAAGSADDASIAEFVHEAALKAAFVTPQVRDFCERPDVYCTPSALMEWAALRYAKAGRNPRDEGAWQ